MDPLILTQIVTLITVIAGFGFQLYRDARNRRWDLDDRKAIASALKSRGTELKDATAHVVGKIEENTNLSKAAFTEANDVNNKIAALGIQLLMQRAEQQAQEMADRKKKDDE